MPSASVRVFSAQPSSIVKPNIEAKLANSTMSLGIKLDTILEEDEAIKIIDHEEDGRKSKPWVEVIRGNILHSNGLEHSYIVPMIVDDDVEVYIEEQDKASETKF